MQLPLGKAKLYWMGESKHDGLAVPGRVVLAHEPPFKLGALKVDAATRQVSDGNRSETLEPRVMQVLVALARANGVIVTRDELIERCWDGRIVTDDAINRVLSRIRHIAEGIGGGGFRLETITKVGYRLVVSGRHESPASSEPPLARQAIDRRWALGLVGATAAVAAGWLWYDSRPSSEALALYRQGQEAQRAGTLDQIMQAVAFFRQATRADPDFAAAWGALAIGYRNLLDYGHPDGERLLELSRSATARALALDPDNLDARAAEILDRPFYRNWGAVEADCRRWLRRDPDHVQLRGALNFLLYEVARSGEAIPHMQRLVRREPFRPIFAYRLILALWSAGRLDEAEEAIERATERWPSHAAIWQARVKFLAFSGRPAAAISVMRDPATRPAGYGPMRPQLATYAALEQRSANAVRSAEQEIVEDLKRRPDNAPTAVQLAATLGLVDFAFALLDGYYLARGPWAFVAPAPAGSFERRYTGVLFTPPLASLRRDPRFDRLTRAIGLNDYWDSAGFTPAHLKR